MSEFLSKRNILRATAIVVGAAALVATPEATSADPKKQAPSKSGISVSTTYYGDGTRMLHYHGSADTDHQGGYDFPSDVFEYCDGPDLVEQTLGTQSYPAGSISRIPDYHGCVDDGKLTKHDFALPKHK